MSNSTKQSIDEAIKKANATFSKAEASLKNAKKDVEAVREKIKKWNYGEQ